MRQSPNDVPPVLNNYLTFSRQSVVNNLRVFAVCCRETPQLGGSRAEAGPLFLEADIPGE